MLRWRWGWGGVGHVSIHVKLHTHLMLRWRFQTCEKKESWQLQWSHGTPFHLRKHMTFYRFKVFFQPACQKFTFRWSETHETASNSRPLQHEIRVNLLCLQMKMHKNTEFWYDWMKTSLKRQSTPRACYRRRHLVYVLMHVMIVYICVSIMLHFIVLLYLPDLESRWGKVSCQAGLSLISGADATISSPRRWERIGLS